MRTGGGWRERKGEGEGKRNKEESGRVRRKRGGEGGEAFFLPLLPQPPRP